MIRCSATIVNRKYIFWKSKNLLSEFSNECQFVPQSLYEIMMIQIRFRWLLLSESYAFTYEISVQILHHDHQIHCIQSLNWKYLIDIKIFNLFTHYNDYYEKENQFSESGQESSTSWWGMNIMSIDTRW